MLNINSQGISPAIRLHVIQVALRDAAEALQLMSLEQDGAGAAQAAAAGLPGRQSGAEAWRSARGETGVAAGLFEDVVGCRLHLSPA
jgi:hypothetical protein